MGKAIVDIFCIHYKYFLHWPEVGFAIPQSLILLEGIFLNYFLTDLRLSMVLNHSYMVDMATPCQTIHITHDILWSTYKYIYNFML